MTVNSGEAGPVMAFDFGGRRIGAALSDGTGSMAFPLATVTTSGRAGAMERILNLIREHRPVKLVVGLPLNMDGTRGIQAERAAEFAASLQTAAGLPTILWDERLTTTWAERSLIAQDVRRSRRRQVRDQLAAVILLQGYLDHRRGEGPPSPRGEEGADKP